MNFSSVSSGSSVFYHKGDAKLTCAAVSENTSFHQRGVPFVLLDHKQENKPIVRVSECIN